MPQKQRMAEKRDYNWTEQASARMKNRGKQRKVRDNSAAVVARAVASDMAVAKAVRKVCYTQDVASTIAQFRPYRSARWIRDVIFYRTHRVEN